MNEHPLSRITAFLHEIGIPARPAELPHGTFLPGLTMNGGAILYDVGLLYPGDLLHEAGHIAFTPAAERTQLSSATTFTLGDDLAAIAWSYAALTHLLLDPAIVFHNGGYQGNSQAFIDNFAHGRYVGVPLLEWAGLTNEPKRGRAGVVNFQDMLKWLRD